MSDKADERDLLTIPEAAERLGVHKDSLYRWARSGQFPPAVALGKRWRVSVPKLERYLHGDREEVSS